MRANASDRRLYFTKQWRRLRARVLREEPTCVECVRDGYEVRPTTDVDHVVPHRGDTRLFFDRSNLRALCHAHHTMKTRRGE